MTGAILASAADSIGWITISNPARRNAVSVTMMGALGETLCGLDADPAVRVLVVRGEGTLAFAAGADISEFESRQDSDEAQLAADKAVAQLFASLESLSKPLIAMIHGYCFGAGVAIALGADIRLAADDSRFAIPAAKLGIGYPVALTQALVRTTGPGLAAEILLTGRALRADEAFQARLVNRLLPADRLEDATRELASGIAANAPLSLRAAKAAIRSAGSPDRLETAEALVGACLYSQDAREGQRAFMEKRPPRFQGS
jgi:enoyl-CoA hydratase/carnithine racemase